MVLDFEYGINTGNRFLDFVDHDEDPEEFIAGQAKAEEKQKKSTKDSKPVTSTSSKKTTSKTSTTATTTSVSNAGSATARTNKENLTGKSINVEQRKQQSVAFSDNNNQQTRVDSGRGGGRGFQRRGGSAGQDRPPYEGGNRGGSQPRPQRFNKFQGQQGTNETTGFEQGADAWTNETGNDNQSFGGYRGRGRGGRGRGNYEGGRGGSSFEGGRGGGNFEGGRGGSHYEGGRGGGHYEGGRGGGHYEGGRGGGHYEGGRGGGHYEGGRGGGGRGRGRGGRGYYNNRNFGEGSQQQQTQEQESAGGWEQNAASNFNNAHPQSVRAAGQDIDTEVSPQEQPFESDGVQRGGRGHFRARTFRNNRQYGGDRPNYYEREGGGQDDYRHNRRQHDRQPRTNLSGVKPIEKKDGEGAHNWGSPTENPDENVIADENAETAAATDAAGPSTKDWSQLVDEAEKQMTLDEYRKQSEAKKKINQEKLPQFNRRTAGEGEDPSVWKEPEEVYRKKNDGDDEEEEETESGAEECGSGEEEEVEEEQTSGKKKIISIPLQFNPIEGPRGPTGSFGLRGGPRRGGSGGRFRERPARNDQPRSNSPTQQQPFSSQQTGDHSNDERPQTSYRGVPRGGPRPGFVRGESRRPYGNSARGSRGGYNRSGADPNAPDLDNAFEFPTLAK